MANFNTPDSRPSLVKVPINYPMEPAVGKISILFDANSNDLYHKFDANNYDDGNGFGFTQPYVYRYPTERQFGFLDLGSGVDDVVRVTKFVASGRGLLFVGKQFLLQGFQAFDETNVYNPTEVILSATSNLTSGLLSSPKRHIDTSGGLLGGLAALVGVGISRGTPPPSTVAAGNGQGGSTEGSLFGGFSLLGGGANRETEVLPVQNYGEGTGLLRAKTANKAYSILAARWGTATGGGGGGVLGFIKGIAKSIIPQVFGADKQNYKQRADELAYDWMVKYYNENTANNLAQGIKQNGLSINFLGISLKNLGATKAATQMTNASVSLFKQKYYNKTEAGSFLYNKDEVFVQGGEDTSDIKKKYDGSSDKTDAEGVESQNNAYFDEKSWKPIAGQSPIDKAYDKYKTDGSEVTSTQLVNDSAYIKNYEGAGSEFSVPFDNTNGRAANVRAPSQNTKLNKTADADSPASQINESLKRVINNIGNSGIYNTNITNQNTWLFSTGNPSKQGYDRLHDIAKTPFNMKNDPDSVESTYYNDNTRTVDSIINPNKNIGLAGNGRPDKVNTIPIIGKDKKILVNLYNSNGTPIYNSDGRTHKQGSLLPGYTEWKPYDDDLIAFFFYDVVNSKYIPFRATVKGISEANNALWDELRFMGRADAIYSYTGFTRNLAFTFTVVVNSLLELWPVWKKINYLSSTVKPAGYTKKVQNDFITNKFMIPPMFMLTIGDLYKYQPIVITTVTMNVPESAIWETVPENSPVDWSYMSQMIKSSVPKDRIGQVPREVEISVACNVLEKERPQVGGNHFGHSPLVDSTIPGHPANYNIVENTDYLQSPDPFSTNLREVSIYDY